MSIAESASSLRARSRTWRCGARRRRGRRGAGVGARLGRTAPEPDAGAAPRRTAPELDQILQGEEDVLAGTTYSYDPGIGGTRSGRCSRRGQGRSASASGGRSRPADRRDRAHGHLPDLEGLRRADPGAEQERRATSFAKATRCSTATWSASRSKWCFGRSSTTRRSSSRSVKWSRSSTHSRPWLGRSATLRRRAKWVTW